MVSRGGALGDGAVSVCNRGSWIAGVVDSAARRRGIREEGASGARCVLASNDFATRTCWDVIAEFEATAVGKDG